MLVKIFIFLQKSWKKEEKARKFGKNRFFSLPPNAEQQYTQNKSCSWKIKKKNTFSRRVNQRLGVTQNVKILKKTISTSEWHMKYPYVGQKHKRHSKDLFYFLTPHSNLKKLEGPIINDITQIWTIFDPLLPLALRYTPVYLT